MPTMVREAWTDERLDDLANRMDDGFREVRADIRGLQNEVSEMRGQIGELSARLEAQVSERDAKIDGLRNELRAKIDGLDEKMETRFVELHRSLQIGFGLVSVMLASLIGLIGTQL